MIEMDFEHYVGTLTFEADALSRLAQGAEVPERLLHVPQHTAPVRSEAFYWAWPCKNTPTPSAADGETGQGA